MTFTAHYGFGATKKVVIKHAKGKFLRVRPGAEGEADDDGGTGEFAQWEADPQNNGNKVRLKSLKTGQYLRIMGNDINVGGGGGKWTVFKVLKGDGFVRLESAELPGKFVACQPGGVAIGGGGKWTHLKFFKEPEQPFTLPYGFHHKKTVVIRHPHGKFLRVRPNAEGQLDQDGGKGEFAQWEADPQDGGNKVRFKSLKSGKYLRIMGNDINVGGGGGKWTVFKVHKQGKVGTVKLESAELSGKYVAVQPGGIAIGGGGKWTVMELFRKN